MEPLIDKLLGLLEEQRLRIARCLERLPEELIWKRPREGVNSVGNLCLHLAGNESHYIGHGIGGTDYLRERSREFTTEGGVSRDDLLKKLEDARKTTKEVLAKLKSADFDRPVAIDHPPEATVLRLLLHVTEHYAYHTGQIILLTRVLQESDERLLPWGH